MATLGVLINHYDARNDIRDLVKYLSEKHKVILLGPPKSVHPSLLTPGVEFRPCQSARPLYNWFLAQLYRHFGFIPKSRENFYINEVFKLERLPFHRRLIAKMSLLVRMYTPLRINPETYLQLLENCDRTPIDDIDGFLLITEFSDNALTARIIKSGKPNCAYVYSWDHPCKHTVMSHRVNHYAVWNSPLATDMNELQGVSLSSCKIVGATQLVSIYNFLKNPGLTGGGLIEGKPYFYFGCGVAPVDLARQEMEIVRRLAMCIQEVAPDYLLLVRPYPMSQGVNLRPMLSDLKNIRWDDEFQNKQIGRSLSLANVNDRLQLQRGAKAFFHIGTTMGFEAAFIEVPSILILPPDSKNAESSKFKKLIEFSNQYHLQKHLKGTNNAIKITDDLSQLIKRCLSDEINFARENIRVKADTPIKPMAEIADQLAALSLNF